MKTCLTTISILLILVFTICVPACALIVIVPETGDGPKISNVKITPLPDHYLEKCIDTIPDKEQMMVDMVKCFYLTSAIQKCYPGGVEWSQLEPYIDYIEIDHSIIVEDDDAIVLNFSDNLMLSLEYGEDSHDLITQATITVVVDDIVWPEDFNWPVTIQF